MTERDDELLDLTALLSEGLPAEEAAAVLGPHAALTRQEVEDRLAMLRRECDPTGVAREMLSCALPADPPHVTEDRP